ncbi:hypothetical protein ACMHYT_22670 [Rhodococcus qingshengii]|jgi:hypothetical protein|uniref:hypothetical protein n=1 Tax=Rhodococcus TaxID=1827 RepID=UPI000641BBA5|nr:MULTISPECIES: hypothetical protein [Rhodococcus]KLN67519.1 hypothetical protein ABM90_32850 [Rhodococcus erythropolis]MCX6474046.1 hypothetical protein [Rhodococcus sp. (in: high G+C Gram-positive bacteria)]MCZ9633465.1 hypothetical protein [Rhodococcus sp. BH5]MDF3318676.1 hypothetical protein [Rhodococcus sp. C3V]NDK70747.1 hypothetical protein [Rhodococcus qingshengii]
MAAEARIVDTVSVEDSRASDPRVASKTEQKDAPKAGAVDLTSADTVGLTSVKQAQRSVPRWAYSEVPLSR